MTNSTSLAVPAVTGDPAASGLNAAARSLGARECRSPC
jgi:hypothetical protein